MPLSTSNSDRRLKAGNWGRTWTAVAVCVLLLLAGWELFWRLQGFEPTVSDDAQLWAISRRRASRLDDKGVVLVGSSRIQLGLNPDVFTEATGIRPVMLAIDGSSPLPVLRHLAEDVEFNSRVIVSMVPMFLAEPAEKDRADEWTAEFESQKWSSRIETHLSVFFQQNLVFRNASLAPDKIWSDLTTGKWPKPPYAPLRADRYRPGYFDRADVENLREGRIERAKEIHAAAAPLDSLQFIERVRRIEAMVNRIQKRGGAVAFVRFPSGGLVLQLEQRDWPRRRYWDILAERIDAPAIHFEDYPALQGFRLPDLSHLMYKDSRRFTRNLVQLLQQKGFLTAADMASDR